MIVTPGPLEGAAARLLRALAAEGRAVAWGPEALPEGRDDVTVVVSDGAFVFDFAGMVRALAPRRFRVLVLSRLGAHPDARAATLQRLWRLEEHVRASNAPVLTLRLAPLVGPDSPLWRMLQTRPALPNGGRKLVNPVAESDVLMTLRRALEDRTAWGDWYECAGPDVVSLAELRDLACASARTTGESAWEPAVEEIAEHRLAECEPWASRFAITPTPLAAWCGAAAR